MDEQAIQKLLSLMGLARRAGKLALGADASVEAARLGTARLLLRWEQSGQRPTLRKRLRIGRRFRLAAGNAEPAAPLNAFVLYPGKTENGSINAIPQTLRKEKER